MIKTLYLIVLMAGYGSCVMAGGYADGETFGNQLKGKGESVLSESGVDTKYIGVTADSSGQKYQSGDMKTDADTLSQDKNTKQGESADVVGKASNAQIQETDNWVKQARQNSQAQDTQVSDLVDKATRQCQTVQGQVLVKEKIFITCDVVKQTNAQLACYDTRKVTVGRKVTYSCEQETPDEVKLCLATLVLSCASAVGCSYKTVSQSSASGDISTSYDSRTKIMQVGTKADNYWHSSCGNFTRTITFHIADVSRVRTFTLKSVSYDDYLWIKINGHNAYLGPHNGATSHRIFWQRYRYQESYDECSYEWVGQHPDVSLEEVCTTKHRWRWGTRKAVDVGNVGVKSCELSTNWAFTPNTDLKSVLQNGTNTIWTDTIVAGYGEFYAEFEIENTCCTAAATKWVETCQ